MSDSQFGQSPGTLAATLDELVALARHLRATPADVPKSLTRLEGLCKMLDYFVAPAGLKSVGEIREHWPIAATTHCSWHDCARTWRDYDACLLNFAPPGATPLWLCRDHHPPAADGDIRPPGYVTDDASRESLESARESALAKLDRATELRLINSRVGG